MNKLILVIALFLASCSSVPFQGTMNVNPRHMMVITPTSDCFLANTCPDYVPYCGECYLGEGNKLDTECVEEAKAAWESCEAEACARYHDRIDQAVARRDQLTGEALSEYFECYEEATTEAEQNHCYEIAQAAIDAAWEAYHNAALLAGVMYGTEVIGCDMLYFSAVDQCCVPCDPWDGWPE